MSTAHSAPAADGPRRLPAVGPFRPREHAFYCRCRVTRRVAAKTWPRPREGADVGDVVAPCAPERCDSPRVLLRKGAGSSPGRAGRLPMPSRVCALVPFDLIGDVLRWPLLACALTMEQRRIVLTQSHLGASVCKFVITVSREKFETAPFGPAAKATQAEGRAKCRVVCWGGSGCPSPPSHACALTASDPSRKTENLPHHGNGAVCDIFRLFAQLRG